MMRCPRSTWLLLACGIGAGAPAQDVARPLVLSEIFTYGSFELGAPDWVELHNPSDQPEPLAGYALQIEGLRPVGDQGRFLHELAAELTVPARSYFLVCFGGAPPPRLERPPNWRPRCDAEPGCGGLCLEYGLDADGGVISLTWKRPCQQEARIPVDAIRYPPLGGGESFGRSADGSWCALPVRTPLAPNAPCIENRPQVIINEVSPVGQPSWVEVYYRGAGQVSLGGYRLENQGSSFEFPGHLVLRDTDQDGDQVPDRHALVRLDGPDLPPVCDNCARFNLKAEGDTLLLVAPQGAAWDGVSIPRLAAGETYARVPDGGDFCVTQGPTPSAPNPLHCGDLPPKVVLIDRFPLRIHPGDPLEVFAKAIDPSYTEPPGIDDLAGVELRWRFTPQDPAAPPLEGAAPMRHGKRVYCERYEEAGIFVGEIPGQAAPGELVFFARAHEKQAPRRIVDSVEATAAVQPVGWQDPSGLNAHVLRLNEVAANAPVAPGDWVEIYNASDDWVSLGGLYLIENNIRPTLTAPLDDQLGIPGRSRLVIYLTDVARPPGPVVRLLLDDCRDELILLDRDGKTVIDFLLFHEEKIDRTLGRLPDGGEELAVMLPSKGLSNAPSSCLDFREPRPGVGLVINEYSADNWGTATEPDRGGEHGDWIELFNSGREAASLDCWSLSDLWNLDTPASRKRWTFPEGITVPAGGFVLVWCDNDDDCETWRTRDDPCWQDGNCELHTSFQLNRVQDFVQLLDPLGEVADFAAVSFQPRDVSAGRLGDGQDHAQFLEPTPGAPNQPLAPARAHFPAQSCNGVRGFELPAEVGMSATPCLTGFQRGDADDNCVVQITDAIRILSWLFAGADAPHCDDAADANDDGKIDLTDAVFALAFLFNGGPPPAAPGPIESGPDPTEDLLMRCERSRC